MHLHCAKFGVSCLLRRPRRRFGVAPFMFRRNTALRQKVWNDKTDTSPVSRWCHQYRNVDTIAGSEYRCFLVRFLIHISALISRPRNCGKVAARLHKPFFGPLLTLTFSPNHESGSGFFIAPIFSGSWFWPVAHQSGLALEGPTRTGSVFAPNLLGYRQDG